MNKLIKYCIELRDNKLSRMSNQKVLIMGHKMVQEIPCDVVLLENSLVYKGSAQTVYHVSREVIQKITGLSNPEPIVGITSLPKQTPIFLKSSHILVLDGIQDPGNLGTLVRSALALCWDGIYVTSGSCDLFNDKALRAAKGATFHIPFQQGSFEEFEHLSKDFELFVADLKGTPISKLNLPKKFALILSREAQGARQTAYSKVTIPLSNKTNSLNVAAAGAILMHEMIHDR